MYKIVYIPTALEICAAIISLYSAKTHIWPNKGLLRLDKYLHITQDTEYQNSGLNGTTLVVLSSEAFL